MKSIYISLADVYLEIHPRRFGIAFLTCAIDDRPYRSLFMFDNNKGKISIDLFWITVLDNF